MNAVRLNTIIASEVILNKTSRRNTVFQQQQQQKRIFIASRRKKWLWKEFDTARRARSKSGFRVRLTRVSHSPRKRAQRSVLGTFFFCPRY